MTSIRQLTIKFKRELRGVEGSCGSDNDIITIQDPIRRGQSSAKLPAFQGKESWEVWFNRSNDVADRLGWDDNVQLVELLPRLQGQARDFVYGQLPKISRQIISDHYISKSTS